MPGIITKFQLPLIPITSSGKLKLVSISASWLVFPVLLTRNGQQAGYTALYQQRYP